MSTEESLHGNLIKINFVLILLLTSILIALTCYFTKLDNYIVLRCYIDHVIVTDSVIYIGNQSYERSFDKKLSLDR